MEILLLYIVFLPFLSGILFLFFRSRLAKYSALFISIIELILTVMLFSTFRSESFQVLSATTPWITTWGIDLELGLDGINVLFVLLTGISIPVILLAGWNKHYHNYGLMDGMVLILQGSLMGVYLSFNAFVYYIFWELTLVPAYLILLLWVVTGVCRLR
jgi:NADH-quinone oxidoreductase subunit M